MRLRLRVPMLALALALSAAGLAGAQPSDRTTALRQRFFGVENVRPDGTLRPDRVILSWFGVTNFAAAIGGHVVLLDAWVPRGEYSGYIPTDPEELAALAPEAIFVGHGHFDHAADAAEIAARSGATIVGTPEHCGSIRAGAPVGAEIACVAAVPRAAPFGTVAGLDVLPGVGITAVKHVHSAAEPPDTSDPHTPAVAQPDVNAVAQHMPAPQDTAHLLRHLGDQENGVVLYQFSVGNFTLTWNDSSGPLKERAPNVLDVLRSLPPTDVQLGAIMGFNQITNGLRDPRMYIEAIHPKVFVPSHHDNWAPGVSTRAEHYRPVIEAELAKIDPEDRPTLRFIGDPQDYVRPEVLTFEVGNPAWD